MKQRDILALMDGIAPGIAASIVKAMAPVLMRLEAAEKRVAELESARAVDFDAMVAAAVAKALAEQPKVADLVAVAVKDLAPAPLVLEMDTAKIKAVVDEAVAALMPKPPTAEEVAALVPPGKDADPEVIRTMVDEAVANLPKAEPGRSVTIDEVRPLVDEAVGAAFATVRSPKDGKDATPEQIAAAVEKVLATWERPKDGESVTLEQLQPTVDAAVEKAVGGLPKPKDGADGVGLAGAIIDRDGQLVITLTDGTAKALGPVVGKDGDPGLGFDDLEVVDHAATVTLRFTRGEQVKEFVLAKPTLADCYRGVWKAGAYRKGDAITWGGSLWLAQADTEARPETDDSWKLVVKRGRDGKDGRDLGPAPPPKPVKL